MGPEEMLWAHLGPRETQEWGPQKPRSEIGVEAAVGGLGFPWGGEGLLEEETESW